MTSSPVFLVEDLGEPPLGAYVELNGAEARHAEVRRIRRGEVVTLSDGRGRGVRGPVVLLEESIAVEVAEHLRTPEPAVRFVAVQALAKGGRDELAIEMMTELGIDEIVPWQAARSVVRWSTDRVEKGLGRWRASVREATKQSRRLRIPRVSEAVATGQLSRLVAGADLALVLHETAVEPLSSVVVPGRGSVLLVVGPEGGIDENELRILTEAGARAVSLGDGVLRASTAGVVALAGLRLRPSGVEK